MARRGLRSLAACSATTAVLLAGCRVPPEGGSDFAGSNAQVRYEVLVTDDFTVIERPGRPSLCATSAIEWVINKLTDSQNRPIAIPRSLLFGLGEFDANGRCILRTAAAGWVPPGTYRIVATDYRWIATCDVALIAQATSGSFHNIRFTKEAPGCTATIEQRP